MKTSKNMKSGHAPTEDYLKRFGHRENEKYWLCGGTATQWREHLFRHCSWWNDDQQGLWEGVE
jgi:hypothetical protein